MTGLKVGLQFLKLASPYVDEANTVAACRNLRAAQTAYEEFLRFLPKAKLTASQRDQVATDLPRLKDTLETLGSRFKIDLPQPDC